MDHYTPLNADTATYMADNLHTNAIGNDVIAQTWYAALDAKFGITSVPEPSALGLLGLGFLTLLSGRRKSP